MGSLEKLSILDPRLQVSEQFKKWFVMIGAKEITTHVFPSTQYSSGYMTFNVSLPNNSTCVVDRSSTIISLPINITMTSSGSAGATLVYQPDAEGLRCKAFDKIAQTLNFNLNGNSVSYQPADISCAQSHCDDNSDNMQVQPTQIDPTQTYSACLNTHRSPFAKFLDNNNLATRASYPVHVVSNTNTQAVLQTTLYVNLFDYDPFCKDKDVVGINIYPFSINCVFVSQLARMWSRSLLTSAGSAMQTLTNFSVSFDQPQLSMSVLTLPDGMSLPQEITYPFHKVDYIPTTVGSLTSLVPYDQQVNVPSNLIELDTCPSKIICFLKPASSFIYNNVMNAVNTTDSFGQFISHKYKFGNRSELLSSQSPLDAYSMSKRNGLSKEITFQQWNVVNGADSLLATNFPNLSGSIIIIDPIRDFYGGNYIAGKSEKIQFQANITYKAKNPVSMVYDLGIVVIYDGIIVQRPNQSIVTTTTVNSVEELKMSPVSYNQMRSMVGGRDLADFFRTSWGNIKRFASPVLDFAKKHQLISSIASMIPSSTPYIGAPAKFVGELAKKYGYGDDGDDGGWIAGEDGDDGDGGILAGGKRLSRNYLKKRLSRR